jgi:histidinol-phosphate aminotransferase
MHAYVPGEQPRMAGLVKLNTNENPYPPAAEVLKAVRAATDARLRLYPNPTSRQLRERLARLHGCRASQVFVGNGSDECLALAVRAFVEPRAGSGRATARSIVQFFDPSYSLYPVLADAHGARRNAVRLDAPFALPPLAALRRTGWRFDAALTFITTPHAPSGRGYRTSDLDTLCRAQRGVVVLDEAYVDFADDNAMRLVRRHPHVLVARTFSKAYSLCFQRVGYVVGHPVLVDALDRIRDSYNVNGLGQVAAVATLDHLPYYRRNFGRVIRTRTDLTRRLSALGFTVLPSQTNFILAKPPRGPARTWLERLRRRRVLVRWFDAPQVRDYLRITVGTDEDAATLVAAVQAILERGR